MKNILLFSISLLIFSCSTPDKRKIKTSKPNILFILADDQRYGTLGIDEIDAVATPNLDKLAQSGVRFNNCYILGAPHGAVCSPSRAMLMTGRHFWHLPSSMHTVWAPELKPEQKGNCEYITLPEVLKENGYYTFTTGKHHNGAKIIERGFDKGKAIFIGGMSTHFGLKVKDFDTEAGWSKPYKDERFSSELFCQQVIDFIDDYNDEKPFFAYLPFTSPHDPRTAPEKYHNKYLGENMSLPANFQALHHFPVADMQIRDERLAAFPRTETEVKQHIADYYAMIEANDSYFGKVIDKLKEKGQFENTIIIFSADNGLAVGQHGLMGKQSVYEHSVKVPLFVSGPGVLKGKINNELVYLHDLFPTLCELLNISIPESVETQSRNELLIDENAKGATYMYNAYSSWRFEKVDGEPCPRGHHRSIRKGDYKLILSLYETKITPQLFNLKEDPMELNNLMGNDDYSEIARSLKHELYKKAIEMGDIAELDKNDWGLPWGGNK